MAETARELRECPFCGCKARAIRRSPHRFDTACWAVDCLECGAENRCFPSEASAIAAWNRRPPSPDVGELVEGLEEVAKQFEFYESEHYSKARAAEFNGIASAAAASREKALKNAAFAKMCRALLAKHAGKG